ncbi:hypothetical protein ALC60_11439 [Trachymyrmex zeteki]|uniref:DUF4817 domain-containing protein n=1 Tax=Mycetomoellerius zeteki TaxID=64791 RepID=A0A151WNW0_9HYME|nr:hypothetical protein ALC60_11439 [Trachymyrmex zeteki]
MNFVFCNMPRTYSNSEYADMVFVYGFCNGNALKAVREYARRFPNRRVPNRRVFMLTFNRLRETGTFSIRQENNRFQAALRRDLQAGNRILQHFDNHPETSVRNASAVLGVSPQTIWRTVKGDNRYPYHIQKVQNLLPQDHWNRLNFCNWNYHIWAHQNPRSVREYKFQQEFSVNVWLGIWNDVLVGPFFLPARLNGDRFLNFLENEFSDYLENIPLQQRTEMWFQLDGCPAHYSRVARTWLDRKFPQRWIGRGGAVHWATRSPDLTPLDFYAWGTLKQEVYSSPIQSEQHLRNRIVAAANRISQEQCLAATRAVFDRCNACIAARGAHFEQNLH